MNSLCQVIQACLGEGDYHSSGQFSVEKNLPTGVNHWSLDVLRALWGNGATQQTVTLRGHRHCPRIYPYIRSSGWSLGLYVKFECANPIPLSDFLSNAVRFCPVPVMVHSNDGGVGQIDLRGQHVARGKEQAHQLHWSTR